MADTEPREPRLQTAKDVAFTALIGVGIVAGIPLLIGLVIYLGFVATCALGGGCL